jgi:hypothetical protein
MPLSLAWNVGDESEAMAVVTQFITGFIGGIVGWLVTQFVAEPLTRFLRMRRDIAQHMLDYENILARCNDGGEITEPFPNYSVGHLPQMRVVPLRERCAPLWPGHRPKSDNRGKNPGERAI